MSESSREDIRLLSAIATGDSGQFIAIISGLRERANSKANSLGAPSDAAEEAINKAVDWLGGTGPFRVSYPMRYVRRLIHNAIVDYTRTHEEEAISGEAIKGELAWIDERMGYFGGEHDQDLIGWHGVKLRKAGRSVSPTEDYPDHPQLSPLRLSSMVDYVDSSVIEGGKAARDKRWGQYKHIVALVDNIPGLREKQVMQCFLWGHRLTDIAKTYCISKAYVSKVITRWLKSWAWGKKDTDKARIILLTNYCATAYSEASSKAYLALEEMSKSGELPVLPEGLSSLDKLIHAEERQTADILYQTVIEAPQTRVYLGGLPRTRAVELLQICAGHCCLWYGSVHHPDFRNRG